MFEETEGDIPGIEKWLSTPSLYHRTQVAFLPGTGRQRPVHMHHCLRYLLPGRIATSFSLLLFNFAMLSPFLARTNHTSNPFQKNMNFWKDMHSC